MNIALAARTSPSNRAGPMAYAPRPGHEGGFEPTAADMPPADDDKDEDSFEFFHPPSASLEHPLTAIVVEDCAGTRELIHMALSDCGARWVVEAADGREAIGKMEARRVDIAVMDWRMDGMDGFECIRLIRSGRTRIDRNLPILLLTGVRGHGVADGAFSAVADYFLEKPFTLGQLASGLVAAMGRNHPTRRS